MVVMGLETEYGASTSRGGNGSIGDDHVRIACNAVCGAVLDGFGFDGRFNGFLPNGARFYFDCGHPEYCSPECQTPMDLVACVGAGHLLMGPVGLGRTGLSIFRNNVNHSSRSEFATWGSHENYSIVVPDPVPAFVSFLASRAVISGVGGIDPADGSYVLDPRLLAVGYGRTRFGGRASTVKMDRLGFDGLGDSLGSSKRLQVHCNGTNCSQLSLYLRFATTALVLQCLKNDPSFGHHLASVYEERQERTAAYVAGARNQPIETVGGIFSPCDLQLKFLELVRKHRGPLPAWSQGALETWAKTLKLVKHDLPSASLRLDWAIKKALLDRGGMSNAQRLELDMRYGQVGSGLFDTLDRQRVLRHRVVPASKVKEKIASAPPGRAKTRAAVIRRIRGLSYLGGQSLSWTYIAFNRRELRMPKPDSAYQKEATRFLKGYPK